MAGRKDKNTVNYFPHYCVSGKTLYIIENKYGNNGYAVLFKTFELLGASEHHYYDFRTIESQEFISAKTRTEIEDLVKIFDTLSNLGTIHKELWEKKIIYSAKFVENIQDAYKRRNNECTTFSNLCTTLKIKCRHKYDLWGQIVDINTQSKEEYSKVDKSKVNKMHLFINSPYFDKDVFVKEFESNKDYAMFNSDYYYEAVKNWSGEGNKTKANWILTARNWAMRDFRENKAKLKGQVNGTSQFTKSNNGKFGHDELERQRQINAELLADRGYKTPQPARSNADTS